MVFWLSEAMEAVYSSLYVLNANFEQPRFWRLELLQKVFLMSSKGKVILGLRSPEAMEAA